MDCIFCKITTHEIPAKIIYEDEEFIVFHDIKPSAPVHVLIVPKKHLIWQSLSETDKELLGRIFLLAPSVAKKLGVYESGYKLVMNCGKGAGQLVEHFHVHFLGGWGIDSKNQIANRK